MANLKGNGTPGRTTQASLGDIYTDETTGKKHKCVFSYKDSDKKTYDTAWVELKSVGKNTMKIKSTNTTKEEVSEVKEPVQETVNDISENGSGKSERKNYTNYSKNNKRK